VPNGQNTYISEDGRFLLAQCDGYLYRENKNICVGQVLIIPKNVDFSVGNIKYKGDVIVHGNVLPDFKVQAYGEIHIKGEVESAEIISQGGSITIGKGVIGKGKTKLIAKKNIHLNFAQESEIEAGAMLTVEKFLLHCFTKAESIKMLKPNTNISGGTTTILEYLRVENIGSEKSVPTKIILMDREYAQLTKKLKEIESLENKLIDLITPVEQKLKYQSKTIESQKIVSPRSAGEIKKTMMEYQTLSKKHDFLKKKKEAIIGKIKGPRNYSGEIIVANTMYDNVLVTMYNKNYENKESFKRVRCVVSDEKGVELVPFSSTSEKAK